MKNTVLYNVLIFDVYNLFYRTFKDDNLIKIDDKFVPIDSICKFFELTNSYVEKFGTTDCKIYWLMDNAKTTILKNRKLLDDNYKKNRKVMPDYFYDALNIVELILKFYRDNSVIYRRQGIEADDYVSNIIDDYIKEHDKIMMFSTDIDWCRNLLDDNEHDIIVNQYTKNNEILNTKTFEEKYGFKPTVTNITFWKTFYGDSADCILATLSNYPKKYFLDVLNRYNHVDSFIKDALEGRIKYLDMGWQVKIKQQQERMRLNWNLISSAEISITDMEQWKVECNYRPNKLMIIYESLNIMGRFDNRIKKEEKGNNIWSMFEGETLNRAN